MINLSLYKKAKTMPEIKQHDSSDKDWINEIDLDEFEDDLSDSPDTTIEDDLDD